MRIVNLLSAFVSGTLMLLAIPSCKEIGPEINLGRNENSVSDTTYVESPAATPENKVVLIEEFTGVRCPNCPQGHDIIASIQSSNPNKVVSVSLHPINSLGAPYSFSVQDFRSQKAQSLFDYLGQIGLEPAAGIDRKIFGGESKILLDKNKWTNYVNQQLTATTPVNILLDKSYDSTNRELTIVVELHYTSAVTEQNKLTVMLTESDIVTPQLDGTEIDTFYNHKDIMRDVISDTQGDLLTSTLEQGRVIRKVYKKVLDALWKPENMFILAYVHEFQNSKIVYQAKEIHVLP
jgi:hypothetical protein